MAFDDIIAILDEAELEPGKAKDGETAQLRGDSMSMPTPAFNAAWPKRRPVQLKKPCHRP
ncbi:hypothetical protein GCM10009038_32670 [Salinicola rhizosphaerae]|uniref:Uncharacterized protein n=1 Tax=Salinicola rhizosphaerae TaxID=1443141 RepID=A0ABQ3EBM3_9GAMM|nr:hypothetical protein GCM10009038_32670 [Salinicola rhizosphaerae]